MTLNDFNASLANAQPPSGLHPVVEALWYDANGNWERAHNIAQSREGTRDYDRLHAYLHRKEGDEWNAGYWYRRAGATVFSGTLDEEWRHLTASFLAK
ncbi:hypothetical protein [Larkinella rosea]|uniref:Uncharacterized protein n=1 Tax=Larkinella rosea TaxID=2025312 RepID=A0A3P1C0I3_9BACT|nr:hypothetical protein [Larkinella rosea]RRB06772.1 hypothetical protein EHT25_02970 [Larkinella rosea]